jgi:methyl-accepting chemotaxis protein
VQRDRFFTTIISEKQERGDLCHIRSHRKQNMILAFVPLEMAPWGISIQEPEEDVFAPASRLKQTFITLAVIFIGTAFILTIGISRSIVDPLKDLIRGTDRIARGDLLKPIPVQGSDEIGSLSQSFEAMRVKLVNPWTPQPAPTGSKHGCGSGGNQQPKLAECFCRR